MVNLNSFEIPPNKWIQGKRNRCFFFGFLKHIQVYASKHIILGWLNWSTIFFGSVLALSCAWSRFQLVIRHLLICSALEMGQHFLSGGLKVTVVSFPRTAPVTLMGARTSSHSRHFVVILPPFVWCPKKRRKLGQTQKSCHVVIFFT